MTDVPGSTVPLPYTAQEVLRRVGPDAREALRSAYGWMIPGRTLDARMQALQLQGRVGFYGATTGHEAVNVAAGMSTRADDWIFPGLREQLVALVRGYPLSRYAQHLFATARDPSRGRQMPCHPTAREVHYVSMSSVIGTQISHAVGTAWAMRRRGAPGIALAFFGDGATSANDFHAGLNFAGVAGLPVIFVCANNQWAISLPVERQSAAATLAQKASAYGFSGIAVDGTDFVAVLDTFRTVLRESREGTGPHFVEFRVYRMTPHSSSDDPSRYQPTDWDSRAKALDPVLRLEAWLSSVGWLDRDDREEYARRASENVRGAIAEAEATPPPDPASLFEDVYSRPLSVPVEVPRA